MYTCAQCAVHACREASPEKLPANCPIRQTEQIRQSVAEYGREEIAPFYLTSCRVEAEGYGQWPRLRETIAFSQKMGYRKLGLAFCIGLAQEARVVGGLLRRHGFEVTSVACKAGGVDKEAVGLLPGEKVRGGGFEAMCNPVAQAALLAEQGTEFNIALGLCVGHDSLFYQYAKAPVTTLVAKDRVLANNPAGAIYCAGGYLKSRLEP